MRGYRMNVKVMKFGGTSLRNTNTRKYVYQHVAQNVVKSKIVVVVSAMGRYPDVYATDTLQSIGSEFLSKEEKARLLSVGEQLSALKICSELLEQGIRAYSLPFSRSGILTDDNYEYAKVIKLDDTEIMKKLQEYDVVVVGGFIGVSYQGNITTLGRGGSDYSATLFAHMLNLKEVEIYTDVDGVYNIDPKLEDCAIKYDSLTYDEMLNMKSRVLHDRCVNYAKRYNICIHLKGTFSKDQGTLIKEV